MKKISLVIFIFFLLLPTANGSNIGELMDIARAQKDAQRSYADETKTFNRVKAAIDSGAIKKGVPEKEIKSRYGEPVVNITNSATGRGKWIYKPAKSSFFSGIKIYLIFDKDKNLDEIKVVE